MAEATDFLAQLRRFGYRLGLVEFVRCWPATAAIVCVIVAAVARIVPLSLSGAAVTLVIGILTASAIAALVARRRAGRLAHTASVLDARFGLANRVATALQFSGEPDAVSLLIVADASAMLKRRRPEDVPLETPRHFGIIVAGAIAVALAVTMIGKPSPRDDDGDRTASQGVLSGVAGGTPQKSGSRPASAPVVQAPSNVQAAQASAAADDGRQSSRSSPAPSTSSSQTSGTQRERQEPGRVDSAQTANRTRAPASAAQVNSQLVSMEGRSGSTGNHASSATANSRPSSKNSLDERGTIGGGAGVTDPHGTTTRAGGVRGAAPLDDASAGAGQSIQTTAASATAASAWDRAEAALAREHLPADRRAYVRDYLIAIRPDRQP